VNEVNWPPSVIRARRIVYLVIMIFEWAVKKRLFRNTSHAMWFLMSVWVLILTTAYYFYPDLRVIMLLPVSIHGVALVQAVYSICIKKISTETLSVDCLWFNAFMVVVYVSLFFVVVTYGL